MRENFLIVGSGGREAAFAQKLQGDSVVYAVIAFANPTIVNAVITSGGEYLIADSNDGEIISQFAVQSNWGGSSFLNYTLTIIILIISSVMSYKGIK